jgi:hypothetical protein
VSKRLLLSSVALGLVLGGAFGLHQALLSSETRSPRAVTVEAPTVTVPASRIELAAPASKAAAPASKAAGAARIAQGAASTPAVKTVAANPTRPARPVDPAVAKRAAALRALGRAPRPDRARIDQLAEAARTDSELAVRIAAVQGLAAAAAQDASLAPAANAVLAPLVATDPDPRLRYEAAVAVRASAADEATLQTLFGSMKTDPDLAVRQASIQTLGDATHSAEVLAQLQDLLGRETSLPLRKSLLASIVRVGREDSVAALRSIAASAPDLAGDANDFVAALGTGPRDMDQIWAAKVQCEIARLGPSRGH